jgi:hypothetical protein
MKSIAEKYNAANVDELVATVKAGRPADQLIWGGNPPMSASPAPEAEVRKIVKWMLS